MSKPPLLSADFDIELNHVNEDLAWGMKGWKNEQGAGQYLYEIHFRTTDDPDEVPIYVREKVVVDPLGATKLIVVPTLVERLVRILTDEDYRRELAEDIRANPWYVGTKYHHEARDVTPEDV